MQNFQFLHPVSDEPPQDPPTQKKNTFTFALGPNTVTLSGDFDSGNLNLAMWDGEREEIVLNFGRDREIKASAKCWFYFRISGNYTQFPLKLKLEKVNSLNMIAKIYDLYRPVVRVEGGEWERHHSPVDFEISPEGDISFRMNLMLTNSQKVEVALCYPWTLKDDEEYFRNLEEKLSKRKDIYYNKETLIYSPEKNPIHLVALSSQEVDQYAPEEYIEHCFPERNQETHFKMVKKPLIMVTARVHPGEIGSSYALIGMLDFLTSGSSEAKKILSEFYFLFVPILNPDGVKNGNNRMDSLGQNLNRFYLMPDVTLQPSCFAVKSLLEHLRPQIYAFFDLHGHASKKSCFLFGNAINNTRLQIESVLFAKYLCSICEHVEFKCCNFSKKQMSSKDKIDDLTKEGCARVVVYKWTNTPYCYTLETGLFKNVRVDDKGIERYGEQFYNPKIYGEVGSKMIVSLFSILKKDKTIDEMRKEVTVYVQKMEKIGKKEAKETKEGKEKGSKKEILSKNKEKKDGLSCKEIEEALEACQLDKKAEAQTKEALIEFQKCVPKQSQSQLKKPTSKPPSLCEKGKGVEEILNRNKNYLLSLGENEENEQE